MLLKYPLTDGQYARFQHANNNDQIQELGRRAGVTITDEFVENGVETMRFRDRCNGTMALVPCTESGVSVAEMRLISQSIEPHHWECWIRVQSKPWWLPWFVLDYGFRRALE